MENNNLDIWKPRILSILRIVAGLLLMQHGLQKLFGALGAEHGPVPALSQMWVAGVLELGGGGLLALGLFTRPVAFVLSGLMAVAYFQAHFPQSFFPVINKGELAVIYCFVYLYLFFAGGGSWSLDSLIARKQKIYSPLRPS